MDTVLKNHLALMYQDALGPLLPLIHDESVREIMVNGPDDVWVESGGQLRKLHQAFSSRQALNTIQILSSLADGAISRTNAQPLMDVSCFGIRFSAVLSPVARCGHALCLRKLGGVTRPLDDYQPQGLCGTLLPSPMNPEPYRQFDGLSTLLLDWVSGRKNLLISGSTSSGKTTFLNSLLNLIPESERVITIEDTHELSPRLSNRVAFEARPDLQITMRDLVRQALRFRPDRIVVGEVRGGEAYDLLQAMNTGHEGCFGTVHANSPEDALYRLQQLVLQSGTGWDSEAIGRQIARCIHGVAHLSRKQGKRQVENIVAVRSYEHGRFHIESVFPI